MTSTSDRHLSQCSVVYTIPHPGVPAKTITQTCGLCTNEEKGVWNTPLCTTECAPWWSDKELGTGRQAWTTGHYLTTSYYTFRNMFIKQEKSFFFKIICRFTCRILSACDLIIFAKHISQDTYSIF